MTFKFYPESFDINRPPPAPPNRDMNRWPFIGWCETKNSKRRSAEYLERLIEWEEKVIPRASDGLNVAMQQLKKTLA